MKTALYIVSRHARLFHMTMLDHFDLAFLHGVAIHPVLVIHIDGIIRAVLAVEFYPHPVVRNIWLSAFGTVAFCAVAIRHVAVV